MRIEMMSQKNHMWVADYFHLPGWTIDSVERNKNLFDNPPDIRFKTIGIDFILKHMALFSLGTDSADIRLPRSSTMHRGVLVKLIQTSNPYFDERGTFYGEIGVKGTGVVAGDFPDINSDPKGFFGYEHAKQEMEVSEAFLQMGGRTSRVLAIIALNWRRLIEWKRSLGSFKSTYQFEENLEKVVNNGDEPALCIRLLGTERHEDFNLARRNYDRPGLFTQNRILQRAARLISGEIEKLGEDNFLSKYELDAGSWQKFPVRKHMLEISDLSRTGLNKDAILTLTFLQCAFWRWNTVVYEMLSDLRYEGKLSMPADTQNYDLAGYVYDWETSLPGKQYSEPDRKFANPMTLMPGVTIDEHKSIMQTVNAYYRSVLPAKYFN